VSGAESGRELILGWREDKLQAHVVDAAHRLGYLTYHTHDSRRSAAGFPDLVLLHTRTGALIFAELKSTSGRLTGEQATWANTLRLGGHDIHVWRPAHWADGIIVVVLTDRARTRR
jgi:VRR-NUC domain